jgi:serine/threonine-protein kinase RsbW
VEHAYTNVGGDGLRTAFRPALRHQLELRVDADPFWLSALRALITDLAIRADFDLDSVADLTLAVDEACAALIGAAAPQDVLVCRFAVTVDRITVTATLPFGRHTGRSDVSTETFGWRVISTLADDVELIRADQTLGIRLTKLRTAAP